MIEYDKGETAYVEVETRDEAEELVDANSVKIDIANEAGIPLVSAGTMTKKSTGKYTYPYLVPTSASSGETFTVKATITDTENNVTIKKSVFKVR